MKKTRNTIAKTKIRDLIFSSSTALSQSQIQNSLDGLCDRVTIYRVLDRLIEEGLIHKIVNTDGIIKFASCQSCSADHNHNHIHFSCEKCKSVTCIDDVEPSYHLPASYKVTEAHFTLSGLCPMCSWTKVV